MIVSRVASESIRIMNETENSNKNRNKKYAKSWNNTQICWIWWELTARNKKNRKQANFKSWHGESEQKEREKREKRESVVLSELHLLRPPLDCSHVWLCCSFQPSLNIDRTDLLSNQRGKRYWSRNISTILHFQFWNYGEVVKLQVNGFSSWFLLWLS